MSIAFPCHARLPLLLAAAVALAASQAPWRFEEDFSHGIPGWISHPFPQDIGYDPSLYTHDRALVREVAANGERDLRVGALRPLAFHAVPSSSLLLSYQFAIGGAVARAHLVLGAVNGRRYTAPLPADPGPHTVRISGAQLQLSSGGTDIEAVVLEAAVTQPVIGSRNRLFLRAFAIEAERTPALHLPSKEFDRSRVGSRTVLRAAQTPGTPLAIRELRVARWDGEGKGAGLWTAEAEAGASSASFRVLVLGSVKPHPRVLLGAGRLMELASDAALREVVRQKAARLASAIAYNPEAGLNIALLSRDSLLAGVYPYIALMNNYGSAIAFNALDYRFRGDAQSLEVARRAVLATVQWETWTPPWFAARGLHAYYPVGEFSRDFAFGYDLIADRFSPQEKARITEAALRNSIQPTVDEYFTYDLMPTGASNHMSISLGGAVALAVALYGDTPDSESRLAPALAKLIVACEDQLRGAFPGDGSEAEPADYQTHAVGGLSWGLAALDSLRIRPRGVSRLLDSFWWLKYAQVNPKMVLCTGDTDDALSTLSGFAWAAEYAGSVALRAFYDSGEKAGLRGLARPKASDLLELVCCTQPALPAPEPPPSRVFPGRGSAALRSGWGPDDTVISIRVGPWFNHEHHDQGSFQVAAFGEKLIAEAGISEYYTDPRYQDYVVQPAGHNTVLVDSDPFSEDFCDGRNWRALSQYPRFIAQELSSGVDYLAADLTPACRSRVGSFTREYVFLKPDVLVIRDRLRAAAPHHYTWLLHLPPGASAEMQGRQAFIRTASASVALTSSSVRWTVADSPLPIGEYNDLDRGRARERREFHLESSRASEVTFLVGIRFGKAAPEPLRAVLDGFQAGERSIVFRGAAAVGARLRVTRGNRRILIEWQRGYGSPPGANREDYQ